MLRNIADAAARQHGAAVERSKFFREQERTSALAEAQWVRRRVASFAAMVLTPSQAKRHQQALVEMGADGLVELTPSHVRVTDKGREQLTNAG
ncbi:hypothetical protein [Lacipirellula parvula]|uniref:Uncharacterized protein n=1 Tax=Lacipirellula parvula TaxID=2650471 RepID=A0A5K7XD38_9BACT|nr:hypothetical protein [Lacipirellula parvula]BBO34730.1 hypothetical protein PLANPX_4342 [Lacipirellula parvula]